MQVRLLRWLSPRLHWRRVRRELDLFRVGPLLLRVAARRHAHLSGDPYVIAVNMAVASAWRTHIANSSAWINSEHWQLTRRQRKIVMWLGWVEDNVGGEINDSGNSNKS